jgi:hypothetical protein
MRLISKHHWRSRAGRIACLIVLGALLAGCDRCGDWWWSQSQTEVCRQQAVPKPQ